MTAYAEFLASKTRRARSHGKIVPRDSISPMLFEFQKDTVLNALERGQCACFFDTGLGKGFIALEWLRHVHRLENKPVLLLAPLAVSHQFVKESKKLSVQVNIAADDSQVVNGINITNYQKLHKFDPTQFAGVALDESSILKSMDSKTRCAIIESFSRTPWRLALTATPAPNDYVELGNHAQFLGVMTQTEMLSMYFINDMTHTGDWRLKGHAQKDFWRWVSSWAITARLPSDIGDYKDDGYILPPLHYHHHVIPASQEEIHASGVLIPEFAKTLADQRDVRRSTIDARVAKCAEIAATIEGQVLVWCGLNTEGDAFEKAIPDAVQVSGADDDEHKENAIMGFLDGSIRVIISKSSIMGFGLNLQCCHDVIFCGISHSFEAYYQSVRRCWRFGQQHPVNVHIVTSEFEGEIILNLKRKQQDAEAMAAAMVDAVHGK
jgi:superfamily II DNA or RNA helicase